MRALARLEGYAAGPSVAYILRGSPKRLDLRITAKLPVFLRLIELCGRLLKDVIQKGNSPALKPRHEGFLCSGSRYSNGRSSEAPNKDTEWLKGEF